MPFTDTAWEWQADGDTPGLSPRLTHHLGAHKAAVPSWQGLLLGGYVQFGELRLDLHPPPQLSALPAHQSPNSSGMGHLFLPHNTN